MIILFTLIDIFLTGATYLLYRKIKTIQSEVSANLFTVQHLSKVRMTNEENNPSNTKGGNLGKLRRV
jgi:hypothetical protein